MVTGVGIRAHVALGPEPPERLGTQLEFILFFHKHLLSSWDCTGHLGLLS